MSAVALLLADVGSLDDESFLSDELASGFGSSTLVSSGLSLEFAAVGSGFSSGSGAVVAATASGTEVPEAAASFVCVSSATVRSARVAGSTVAGSSATLAISLISSILPAVIP